MGEFLKDWRRKLACLLLVCDCMLVSLWMTSRLYRISVLVRVTHTFAIGTETRHGYFACVMQDSPAWVSGSLWWDFAPSAAVRSMEQYTGLKFIRLMNIPVLGLMNSPEPANSFASASRASESLPARRGINGVIVWLPTLIVPLTVGSLMLLGWPQFRRRIILNGNDFRQQPGESLLTAATQRAYGSTTQLERTLNS